jgi:hypothetical protein
MSQAAMPDRAAHFAHAREHVGAARFEQGFLGQRARRDEAHDVARDQRLGSCLARLRFLGRFGLFGNGDAAPGLDQPREIALGGMDRHAAHRDRLAPMFAPAGQRDVEDLRGRAHRRRTSRKSRPCGRTAGIPAFALRARYWAIIGVAASLIGHSGVALPR